MRAAGALALAAAIAALTCGKSSAAGSIVYANDLMQPPASGIVELTVGAHPQRRSVTARTGISGLLPAESPDGRLLAWVFGDHVFLADPAGGGRRDLGPGVGPVAWSPDGTRLAFGAYNPSLDVVVADLATGIRHDLGSGNSPSWSPDGAELAFVTSEGVGIVHADGSGRRLVWAHGLSTADRLDPPAWSPDGRRLAVSQDDVVYDGPPFDDGIVVLDLATGASIKVREWARHPEWSPAGDALLYERAQGARAKQLVLLDPAAGTRRVVATLPTASRCEFRNAVGSMIFRASFSPSGNRIAFAYAQRRQRTCQTVVGTIAPDGSARRALDVEPLGTRPAGFAADGVGDAGPRWRRDGKALEFAVERHTRTLELYVRNEEGTRIRRITVSPQREHDPRFSPDGTQIVFVRGRSGRGGGIWISDARGGRLRRVTTGDYPTWSPDGRRIAFCRKGALYVVPAAGGREVQVLGGGTAMPDWSPDGRVLAFTAVAPDVDVGGESHTGGIRILDLQTRRVRRASGDGLFPRWSPDGSKLAYTLWAVGPDELDIEKDYEYPFLRISARDGQRVDFGDDFSSGYDAAWAPDGERLIMSGEPGLFVVGPLFARPPGSQVAFSWLPGPLGISWPAVDPDWSRHSLL
jgi:Tol biopolymer transport system component